MRGFANRLSLPGHFESKTTTPHQSIFGRNRWGADNTSRLIVLFDGTNTTLFQFNRAGSRREASIRRLFISIAVLQITLSIATAQPVTNLTTTQSASLDQHSNASEISPNKAAKPRVHRAILSPPETVAVLPLAPLQLLLKSLIGGATSESGIASVYAGGLTANGEQALSSGMTAAHRSIPFGTRVRVTNRANGKSVVVRINDRGPFFCDRIIDLMPAAARALGFSGLTPVTLGAVGRIDKD